MYTQADFQAPPHYIVPAAAGTEARSTLLDVAFTCFMTCHLRATTPDQNTAAPHLQTLLIPRGPDWALRGLSSRKVLLPG